MIFGYMVALFICVEIVLKILPTSSKTEQFHAGNKCIGHIIGDQ